MDDNRSQRIAKNTFFLYIRMFFVLVVGLYISRIVLRNLGVEDFGIYSLVASVVVFLNFLQAALNNATARYLTYEIGIGNIQRLTKVYSMAINCHILLALILFVIMEVAGVWFLNNKLNICNNRLCAANWLFQFSLGTFVLSIIRTPYISNVIAHEKMGFYAFASIIEIILKLGVALSLIYVAMDRLILYSALLFVVSLIVLLLYGYYCFRNIKETRYLRLWDAQLLKDFSSYSGWSLFVNGADICTQQSITIFFNWFIGIVGNAALGVVGQVNAGLNLFVSNFCQAFNPQLIKSYANKDYSYFLKLIYSTSKIAYILFVVIAIPIAFNLDLVLKIWLGKYPNGTIELVVATLVYYMFDSLQSPLFQAVHATGYIRTHHIIVGTLKALAIPAIYLTLRLGYSGATALFVWSLSNVIVSFARVIYMKTLIQLDVKKYLTDVFIPLVVLTGILIMAPLGINMMVADSIARLLLHVVITILIILCSLKFILNKEEKALFVNIPLIHKVLNKFNITE